MKSDILPEHPKKELEEKKKARLILLLMIARYSATITMIIGLFIFVYLALKWVRVL